MNIEDEITPDLAKLKTELWAIRYEMVGEKLKHAMEAEQRAQRNWSDDETAILKANLGSTDREIAKAISALGRKRSVKAVGKKRREYEPAKSPSMGRKTNDWPRVHGDIETQSKRFARALLEAMLAEHRARRLG